MTARAGLARWHAYMENGGDPERLADMIAPGAIFHSPVVHTPQQGHEKVFAYLDAASKVLGGDKFHYLREIVEGDQACLEFVTEVDGIEINGVDIIRWNSDGKIIDFKVMVRPIKAINKLWEKMAAMLEIQAS
jgi:hypothetical protein